MRRIILLLGMGMCATCVFANNEAVYTISYNPSRLGVYEQLKAVYGADLQGGVEVENGGELNIQSAAGKIIELEDEQNAHKYNGGNEDPELNSIVTVEPIENEIETSLKGEAIIQKWNGSTTFWPTNAAGEYEYKIESPKPNNSSGTNITIYGGKFEASNDSYIEGFDDSTVTKLKANVDGTLEIGGTFHALDKYTLGNITIKPTSCSSGCVQYQWVNRADQNGEGHRVLAVKVLN